MSSIAKTDQIDYLYITLRPKVKMMRYKTATQWGVFDVEVLDGKITSVQGITADAAR